MYGEYTGNRLRTLVSKRITAIQHAPQQAEKLGILLELIPRATEPIHSLFLLNMYSRPKCKAASVHDVITQAIHKAGITGDFNAAHQLSGYKYSNTRGNALHAIIKNHDLALLTNPTSHTCMGNSVTKDTSQDLTITGHIPHVDWAHLGEYLGSDHAILATTIHGTACLNDWTKFREE
ncbi:hypothetical protein HPB48_001128 [Haemaphysalis longicornis]|uniref:Endonuclease/exonuclease/phosphatase domain-containing protein n=1 Tax=Haemaphysalis longicornis TaxID=44386 RepID=A0A9J6GHH1_HAELO|nr:hypothetical protein HPB48_001128 [Haemaphysalis longicornis]